MKILALDVGTSSVRAGLYDAAGRRVGPEVRRAYSPRTTPDGGSELNADELALHVESCLDEVHGGDAVAICTFWHSLVGVGPDGAATTPILTWADTRSAPAAAEIGRKLDGPSVHARTGCMIHPCYLPAKIRWWSRGRETRWMSIGEFLHQRFFGKSTVSLSTASATGLMNLRTGDWDEEMLRAAGVERGQLSTIGDAAQSGLLPLFARRWPSLKDAPWLPAVGDGACNSIGSGASGRERLAVMIGTSGAMRAVWRAERVSPPPGLFCYRPDAHRFVVGGALSEGGNLVEWIRRTFRDADEAEASALAPDAHGLTFLPFISGERAPGWAAEARATIHGLTLDTRPAHILRAAMEAVAFRFALIHQVMRAALPEIREVIASGGALLRSPAWMQILADVLDRPVTASAEPEASSRGVALWAAEALGALPKLEEAPAALGATYVPDPARRSRYEAALERHRDLYARLAPQAQKTIH